MADANTRKADQTQTASDASAVDFYVLSREGPDEVFRCACRLAEKAWRKGHRVYVLATTEEDAKRLDALLWTFSQDSFVPHRRVSNEAGATIDEAEPVLIGTPPAVPPTRDVVINLTAEVPDFAADCQRLLEIVGTTEGAIESSRNRYRAYQTLGFAPRSHHL